MIDDETTTDAFLPGTPVLTIVRDELARALHDYEHGSHDDATCWASYEPEAAALLPVVKQWLARAWLEGARDGSRGLLPKAKRDLRNPYQGGAA